jgi:hypothetical protein
MDTYRRVASPTRRVSRTMGTIVCKPLPHVTHRRHNCRLRQGPRRWRVHTTDPHCIPGISSPTNQRSWRSGTSPRGCSLAREWNQLDSIFVTVPSWHPVNAAGSQGIRASLVRIISMVELRMSLTFPQTLYSHPTLSHSCTLQLSLKTATYG